MSRVRARRLIVAYDVPSDRRRTRLANVLLGFGDRIQYSVFVVDAAPAAIVRLKRELREEMVSGEDSVLICDLGLLSRIDETRFSYLGRARPITNESSFIL